MDSSRKLKLVAGAVVLAGLAAGGGAIAATKLGGPGTESKAIIDDAAGRLGISPNALSDALKKALEARVDAAVQAGTLTKAQGDALKQRIEAQDYPPLGFGLRGFDREQRLPGFGFLGFGVFDVGLDTAATYLELTPAQLRTQLSSGKTLAQIATDQKKTAAGLVTALVTAAKAKLADAVKAGKLTQTQADSFAAGLEQRITDMVNGAKLRFRDGRLPLPVPGFRGRRGGGFALPA